MFLGKERTQALLPKKRLGRDDPSEGKITWCVGEKGPYTTAQ